MKAAMSCFTVRRLSQGGQAWMAGSEACWSSQVRSLVGFDVATRSVYSDSGSVKKGKQAPLQERKMVDRFRLHVRGGEGGSGCTSFRKSRHSRHGTADGGNGGKGGDVILVSSGAVWDFSNLQHHLNAKKGGQGSSKRRVGSRGVDKVVQVPVGTVVHLVSGSVPSLEQPSVTPDQTPWERWKVPGHPQGVISENGAEANGATSAEWLDNLCLDNAKAKLAAKDGHLAAGERPGLERQEEHADQAGAMETASPGPVEVEDQRSCGDDDVRSSSDGIRVGEEDASGDVYSEDEDGVGEDDEVGEDIKDDEDIQDETILRQKPVTQYAVAEFVTPGQSLVMASGGEGGHGNATIARGVGRQKSLPSLEHENGLPGSEAILILELKTIADVGLVGAPNAGKSTLLGALSRAKPAIGHYAFTTLRPNIGKLEYEDFFALTVADIPGLIRGAHQNCGLGHAFLRHIERTKALAYVVDLSAGIGDKKGPLPWDQLEELRFELDKYEAGLSTRSALIVANKIDEPGTDLALEELRRRVAGAMPIFPVCAVLEEGIGDLRVGLRELVDTKEALPPRALLHDELFA